ncbi:MAG: ABC transporter permease [Gemmatimonadota bacterium]|nr:ABC transporter permease [Gemmatimonadota bacterium]
MTTGLLLRPFRPIRRRHIALLRQIAAIQHGLRDQSTSLGFLWSFLHPLILLLVLYAFFRRLVGQGIAHYPIFLLIGLVQFTHFSKSTASAMRILNRMRSLATNVIFPKDILVYSSLLSDLPEFLISMAATLVIALLSGVPASWALLALPVIVVLQVLLVLWISLLLSVMYVFVRDLDHIFEVGMRLMFFVTPIFYSIDSLTPTLRRVALLNPLAHLIGYARGLILEGRLPPTGPLCGFTVVTLVLIYASVVIFRRAEPAIVEQL